MGTLLDIFDFIVLLLLFVHLSRAVWRGSGSMLLTIFISLAAIIFVIVSYTSYLGLVGVLSLLMQGVLLVVLLAMAALVALSWTSKSVV
jgi:hypothetical protein